MIERRYALTKIRIGDYLLPSNDGQILWRISAYQDGPSHGLLDWPRDRDLWMVRRWADELSKPIDVDDPDLWVTESDGYETRRAAVEAALTSTRWADPDAHDLTLEEAPDQA